MSGSLDALFGLADRSGPGDRLRRDQRRLPDHLVPAGAALGLLIILLDVTLIYQLTARWNE